MTKQVKSTEQSSSLRQKAEIIRLYFTKEMICAYCAVSWPTFLKVIAGKAEILHPNTMSVLEPRINELYTRIQKASAALN